MRQIIELIHIGVFMSWIGYQREAAAILYAVLGQKASPVTFNRVGDQLTNSSLTGDQYVQNILSSSDGLTLYAGKTTVETLQIIYTNVYGQAASIETLNQLISSGDALPTIVSNLVNNLLNYSGFDPLITAAQDSYIALMNTILYPSANALASAGSGASDVQAIHYVLGAGLSPDTINTWGAAINSGSATSLEAAQAAIDQRAYLVSETNQQFITRVFTQGFERPPTQDELNTYLTELNNGTSRAQLVLDIIDLLSGTVDPSDATAQIHFNEAVNVYAPGDLPSLAYQEQVSAAYIALLGRGIDAQGLDTYSKKFVSGTTLETLAKSVLNSAEYATKGVTTDLNGFIQYVYTELYGVAPTSEQVAAYAALGSLRSNVVAAIINDLRDSTSTNNAIITSQHQLKMKSAIIFYIERPQV